MEMNTEANNLAVFKVGKCRSAGPNQRGFILGLPHTSVTGFITETKNCVICVVCLFVHSVHMMDM